MHSEDHSFLIRCFANAGHALLAQKRKAWCACHVIKREEWICMHFPTSFTWDDILEIPLRQPAAISSPLAYSYLLFSLAPTMMLYNFCLSWLRLHSLPLIPAPPPKHPSPHLWSPLQLLQHSETGEMGCLATGCSWTNSIPLNELTVMCLNRKREQETGRRA